MKTLFLYVAAGKAPVSSYWPGLKYMVENESRVGHVVDVFNDNLVETIDVAFHAYSQFLSSSDAESDFLSLCADQTFEYIVSGPIQYDLIVAGQTPVTEKVIVRLNGLKQGLHIKGIIRFSSYYGNFDAPYPECIPPATAGYEYDCPKDYQTLLHFLNNNALPQIERGIQLGSIVGAFNRSPGIIGGFKQILPIT